MPESELPLPIPPSILTRWLYALIATVIPTVSFALGDVLKPEWQSGRSSAYVALMLGPSVTLYFYPFLLYSVVCLLLLLWQPGHYARKFTIRLGIYTGILLSLHYMLLIVLMTSGLALVVGPLVIGAFLLASKLWRVVRRQGGVEPTWSEMIDWRLAALIGGIVVIGSMAGFLLWVWALVILLVSGPFFCLYIGGTVYYQLLKDYEGTEMPLGQGLSGLGWLTAYLVAWRLAIQATLEAYAALPPHPPDCYIATAAAQGHRRLTRARPVRLSDGHLLWVNAQLRYLKCGELALQAVSPATHRRVRRVYDCVGLWLARRLRHPLLADVAYLSLKPVEWGTVWLLRRWVPNLEALVARLYQ
jgi:hypothetical protein